MLAPNMNENDKVILFDGVCKLCSAWARFLIRFDKKRVFKLATVQSPEGQAILALYGLATDYFETIIYVEGENIYTKSTAFLKVMKLLGLPWAMFGVFGLIPKTPRDWLYDRIALNRYKIFGKHSVCLMPTADHDARFLRGK